MAQHFTPSVNNQELPDFFKTIQKFSSKYSIKLIFLRFINFLPGFLPTAIATNLTAPFSVESVRKPIHVTEYANSGELFTLCRTKLKLSSTASITQIIPIGVSLTNQHATIHDKRADHKLYQHHLWLQSE